MVLFHRYKYVGIKGSYTASVIACFVIKSSSLCLTYHYVMHLLLCPFLLIFKKDQSFVYNSIFYSLLHSSSCLFLPPLLPAPLFFPLLLLLTLGHPHACIVLLGPLCPVVYYVPKSSKSLWSSSCRGGTRKAFVSSGWGRSTSRPF